MDYNEAINYIHSTYRFGSKLGLDNIKRLMNKLGNPQNNLKIIHVAGTNGKGSISTMIRSVLTESGYRTGFFISPYLERFTERIQIDDQEISRNDLATTTTDVKKAVEEILQEGYSHPTEFEIVTAIGFLYFFRKEVDFLVLEVGLGGRFDATNVIENSLVSVIASISLEHTEYLGDTLEKIAYEKSGIIKDNNTVVVYPQSEEILKVIKTQADIKNSKVYIPISENLKINSQNKLSYTSDIFNINNFTMNFKGEHQMKNLVVSIKVLEILKNIGYKIDNKSLKKGIESAFIPGRFEIIQYDPTIIIDVAHNKDGIDAFTDTLMPLLGSKKLLLFIGMLEDKKPENLNIGLINASDRIYTLTPKSPRSISSDKLKDLLNRKFNLDKVTPLSSYEEAVSIAKSSDKDYVVAFIGSFYMVGEIRTLLKKL